MKQKTFGFLGVFAVASGAMISSGLFILPGLAHAQAGPAVVISYLLAGVLCLPGMLSVAEMTTAMPKTGGDAFAIMRSLGPAVGTVAGLLSWFSLSMKSAFALVGIAVFVRLLINIDPILIGLVFAVMFTAINLLGAQKAKRAQLLLVGALLVVMTVFVVLGLPQVRREYMVPFVPYGIAPVLATSGFVFVSFAGLIQIASIAGEIRKPGRTIPWGMAVALVVVSAFYALMVYVASGVLAPEEIEGSLTPLTDAAEQFMGPAGAIALTVAAVLAFLSTANAGIMSAARTLVPLSQDRLFPEVFGRLHPRFGTPAASVLLTGGFVAASLFLKLEILVEAASLVVIVTNILASVSVVILRSVRLQSYRPSFRAPLTPWIQIAGIIALLILVLEMGLEAILISLILVIAGGLTYWFYGRIRGYREYALLHLIASITSKELADASLERELREILRERDEIRDDRFDRLVRRAEVVDIEESVGAEKLFTRVAESLAGSVGMTAEELAKRLEERERASSTVLSPFVAIPHVVLDSGTGLHLSIVRCREGVRLSEEASAVRAVFVLVGGREDRHLHLVSIAAIAQLAQDRDFDDRWFDARNEEMIRSVVLLAERRRHDRAEGIGDETEPEVF